jgi:hypothetical protein
LTLLYECYCRRERLPGMLQAGGFDWVAITSPEAATVFLEGWRAAGSPEVRQQQQQQQWQCRRRYCSQNSNSSQRGRLCSSVSRHSGTPCSSVSRSHVAVAGVEQLHKDQTTTAGHRPGTPAHQLPLSALCTLLLPHCLSQVVMGACVRLLLAGPSCSCGCGYRGGAGGCRG